ncbi:MAG: GDSL-type esterase/lipase family protein [Terracidiphilus sp.]
MGQTPATLVARLEIHAVDGGPFPTQDAAKQSVKGAFPPNEEILSTGNLNGSSGSPYYVVERSPIVAGSDFRSIQPGVTSNTGQITVDVTLTAEAGDKFFTYTSANIGKSMAVVLGGTVRDVAVIKTPIRDQAVLEGSFSQNEVTELAQTLAAQPAPAPPATSPSGHPNNAYWIEHDRQLMVDFGGLNHFKDADAILGAPKPGRNRVVFMGDSITEAWKLNQSFPGKAYVNRGISGQTTPQMLVRFRQDVIGLQPKVVVILAGTNDIAGNTGPMTIEQTEGNLASMAELARANGIHVVLCSILPAFDYWWAPGHDPAPKIAQVNAWLKNFAARHGYVYVDYYSAMKNDRGGLPAKFSKDGVHPLPAGFAVMTPLLQRGIEQALKTGK